MIRLISSELFQIELRARMPFRYGIATMTEVPHAILRMTFEIDGVIQAGLAADSLAPKWFTKDPARALDDEVAEIFAVIRAAVAHARGLHAATAFGFWRELWAVQAALGTTSVERNGHHYFAGLAQFPAALQAHVLAHHGDLFVRTAQGWPRLNLREGRLALGSVNAAPLGVPGTLDLSAIPREEI